MRVYRIDVTSWPTENGRPWERWVDIDDAEPWLLALHEAGKLTDYERNQSGDYTGEVLMGWVLPATHRRNYLARAAAYKWLANAMALGAVATVAESEPVAWKELA